MMTINEINQKESGVLTGFTGTATTSAALVKDINGNNLSFTMLGLEIQNLGFENTNTIQYSFDNSNFFTLLPGEVRTLHYQFENLYIKCSADTVTYQGWVVKKQ